MYKFPIGVIVDSFRVGTFTGIAKAAEMGADGIQLYCAEGVNAPENMTADRVRELLDRLLTHIEVMILTGNGKNFIAPAAETLQKDANNNPKYHAINYLPYNEGLVAVVTRSFYADLLQKVQTDSNYLVVADADNVIRNILGVDEVIMTPPTFTTTGH